MNDATLKPFQADVTRVLSLVINSLYSNKEIFLRELVSNASDALDRLRFRAISEPDLMEAGERLTIRIVPDRAAGTLTISDNGIGMTAEELTKDLGTIARSGSREFLESLEREKQSGERARSLVGQFGVGFYSAYLVADEVEVVSRAAGSSEGSRWVSRGEQGFRIEPAQREERGTSVILHLRADQREFLEEERLRELVLRYSDFIGHAIELSVMRGSGADAKRELEVVNRGSALWQRPPKEVTDEQYEEFYRHLTHDWEPPLTRRHFHIEGSQMFVGLLFVPRRRPFDLFDAEARHGIRLHVRRVLVMDSCEELAPRWLRFVRGVVDSEDLPLNVSRETLQDSRAIRIIKKQVVSQVLDALEELARERPDDYATFWGAFGAVLKEGLHFDPEYKTRLAELVRFESSTQPGLVSLGDYLERMKPEQSVIYYAAGTSRSQIESSPHLETLRQRGIEVLLMTDPIDAFVAASLGEYRDKKLASVMTAELDLPAGDAKADKVPASDQANALLARFRKLLEGKVADVRASSRLTDSPACLVVQAGGLQPHIERLLRARQLELPKTLRVLECNLTHPLLVSLAEIELKHPGSERVAEWIALVYDQALLAEGSAPEDPALFARRMGELLSSAAALEAQKG